MEMLQRATTQDIDFCFNLRNHPTVFPLCGRPRQLTKEEYLKTLSLKTHLFVIMAGEYKAGYIRFDPEIKEAYGIGIALLPEHRGHWIGQCAIRLGMKKMKHITTIFLATVRKNNEVSNKLFLKCGFQLVADDDNFNYYGHRG